MLVSYDIFSVVSTEIQELDSSLIQVKAAKTEVWHTDYLFNY